MAARSEPRQHVAEVGAQGAAGEVAHPPPGRAVVPAALHPPARPTRRVCDRRVGERMRACGSAKILRTIELGIPEGDTHPTAGTVVAGVACVYHVRFLRSLDSASSRTQSGVPPPQPPHFTHSLPRRATKQSVRVRVDGFIVIDEQKGPPIACLGGG
jgi:hypothetical protein